MNIPPSFPSHIQNQGLFKEYFPTLQIHERNWEEWDFQSISITESGQMLCYTRVREKGVFREVVEVYSGENYVAGSNKRSYSRVYQIDEIPNSHEVIVDMLKTIMLTRLGTKLITP